MATPAQGDPAVAGQSDHPPPPPPSSSARGHQSIPSSESQPDLIESTAGPPQPPPVVDITNLLRRLWPQQPNVTADEISDAVAHFFSDRIDDVQTGALLMTLHFTGLDRDPKVLSQCARKMLQAAARVDSNLLASIIQTRGLKQGSYQGGFVSLPIVGKRNVLTIYLVPITSAISSAQAATPTTPSTSPRQPPSSLPRCSSSPSMATAPPPPSPAPPT